MILHSCGLWVLHASASPDSDLGWSVKFLNNITASSNHVIAHPMFGDFIKYCPHSWSIPFSAEAVVPAAAASAGYVLLTPQKSQMQKLVIETWKALSLVVWLTFYWMLQPGGECAQWIASRQWEGKGMEFLYRMALSPLYALPQPCIRYQQEHGVKVCQIWPCPFDWALCMGMFNIGLVADVGHSPATYVNSHW